MGEEGQRKLLASSVLIVGAGGLGSPIALYLTAAGVGHIGIVDDDSVSISNLQRQVLYCSDEVNQSKVVCAKRRLNALSPETKIEIYNERLNSENAPDIISAYDIVVDGCDNFATRYLIDDVCYSLGKPYVYGAIGEFNGQVAVFNHNGSKRYRDLFPDEEELIQKKNSPLGVIGTIPGVIGSIEATEVIKIIVGSSLVLRDKLFMIDLRTLCSQTIQF